MVAAMTMSASGSSASRPGQGFGRLALRPQHPGESLGSLGRPVPDHDPLQRRAYGEHRLDDVGRQRAGSHHQHLLGLRRREEARAERAVGGRLAEDQRLSVDDGPRLAGLRIEDEVERVDRRQAEAFDIAGERGHDLDAERFACLPGRHGQQHVGMPVLAGLVERQPRDLRLVLEVAAPHRLDGAGPVEQPMHGLCVDHQHQAAASAAPACACRARGSKFSAVKRR
jgi:hypothetical protein